MTATPIIGIPEAEEATSLPWSVVNYMIRVLEAGCTAFTVLDTESAPPGSPAEGNRYRVGAAATGAWAGWDDRIVVYIQGDWFDIIPIEGFRCYDIANDDHLLFDGTVWGPDPGAITVDTDGTLAANSDGVVPSQKAIKTYVDSALEGRSWKQAVRVATTGAVTLASGLENGDTIDGVVLATGNRILVKDQASATENGFYTVNASGAPTRATDADTGAELVNATVFVSEGTVNAETVWTCSNNTTITIGVTNITFVRAGTTTRPVSFFFTTTPTGNELLLIYTPAEIVMFADDFAGSECDVGTNPTSSFVLTVKVNGSSIGTITINTSGVATFVTSGGALTLAIGDRLTVEAPASPDATIANVAITLKGRV